MQDANARESYTKLHVRVCGAEASPSVTQSNNRFHDCLRSNGGQSARPPSQEWTHRLLQMRILASSAQVTMQAPSNRGAMSTSSLLKKCFHEPSSDRRAERQRACVRVVCVSYLHHSGATEHIVDHQRCGDRCSEVLLPQRHEASHAPLIGLHFVLDLLLKVERPHRGERLAVPD